MAGPEFDSDQRKAILVARELYGLNLSRADFRVLPDEQFHDFG